MGSVLKATQLVVVRGTRRTLDGIDLAIAEGEVYALLGGNGAGKTTTINTFLGFIDPAAGSVHIDGVSPAQDRSVVQRRVAYLPENVALYPYLSGIDNVRYFCRLAGVSLSREQIGSMLNDAGLQTPAHAARVATYSKGMRQKVGLAIAHAKQARAMLLDEPTSGLDPAAANEFAHRIRAASAAGMAILIATHDLYNTLRFSDRIGILKAGRLVEEFATNTVDYATLERRYLAHAGQRVDA